jgi:hypothetical protein
MLQHFRNYNIYLLKLFLIMKRLEKTIFYRDLFNDIDIMRRKSYIRRKFHEVATASEFKNSDVQL